jgi:hypothetical protein
MDRITLDFMNSSAFISLNGITYLFKSTDTFKNLTKYPFDNTILLSYEPDRNLFAVERKNGDIQFGDNSSEILWCEDNIDIIVNAAYQEKLDVSVPGPSFKDIRNSKLSDTDWMVIRHKDQKDLNLDTTLSNQQYLTLLNYRQQLRDITSLYSSLDNVVWPLLDL